MDTNSIGRILRQIRHARGKSLATVAQLAGISPSYLSMLESGTRALDSRSLTARLANALEVAPAELAGDMITPAGGMPQDRNLTDVRQALMAVSLGVPSGEVVPADRLRSRVEFVLRAQQECRYSTVGENLPTLIRDLHTTLDSRHDERDVLRLATLLHLQGTQSWLWSAGGSADLVWLASTMSRNAAECLEEPVSLGLAAFGTAHSLISVGDFDLAGQTLESAQPGTETREAIVVTGMLTLTSALVAAAQGNDGARQPALEEAGALSHRLAPGPEPWFGFGPSNVSLWRMSVALEAGNHVRAAEIASRLDPAELPSYFRRANYYVGYGRALARLPKQRERAASMLRKAEQISPARVHRNPLARATLGELLARAKYDAVGRELRGMAHRAGLAD